MAALSTDLDASVDHVVLLSTDREPVGSAPRAYVHTRDTPLHLAFSLYVFNESGEVLLTRRALTKTTWPGVWTNTCCGHPRPGEDMSAAIARRLDHELGMEITDLECVLPDFGYRATDASGLVENEFCPVFRAHVRIHPESSHPNDPPLANPDEVLDWKWWKWNDVIEAARLTPFVFSPWSVQQMAQLSRAPD
jgi:isopentenyl-diphosphate delta-isomerase type 1